MNTPNYENTPEWELEDQFSGRLAKVKAIEDDGHRIVFQMKDNLGQLTQATSTDPLNFSEGDVILVGNNSLQPAPSRLWTEDYAVGIVRKVLEDKILIETNIGLKTIKLVGDKRVQAGNTIEFDETEGVISILSESPIRIRDMEIGDDDIIRTYHIPWETGGHGFDSFGGYADVVTRAKELIETQLDRMEELNAIGARPVKGVLFTGPPGTGKTHLARIIAYEAKADLFLVSGPSVVSKWVGDSEETLRRIFAAAAEKGRAIIFFDEIDSIAERRSGDSHEASKRLVAQLLTLMDGFDQSSKQIIVIAATNRRHDIDEALLRPGRFDWEIEFGLPTDQDRYEILSVGAGRLQNAGDLPLQEIAQLTVGWSAARLTQLWTEAASVAARDGRKSISGEDMAVAFERECSRPMPVVISSAYEH